MDYQRKQDLEINYPDLYPDLQMMTSRNNMREWIGRNIPPLEFREIRKDLNDLLGISEKTWQNYLGSKYPIPSDIVKKLCVVFSKYNCIPSDLLFTNAEREVFEKFELTK